MRVGMGLPGPFSVSTRVNGGGCLGLFGIMLLLGLIVRFWYVVVPVLVTVVIWCWVRAGNEEKAKRAGEVAARAEAMEKARQAELEQAQLQYHRNALACADPVYTRLMDDLLAVPESRSVDRARGDDA